MEYNKKTKYISYKAAVPDYKPYTYIWPRILRKLPVSLNNCPISLKKYLQKEQIS